MAVGGTLFFALFNSESAVKAKELAEQQLGSAFKYHINSLSMSGSGGSAIVTAYNQKEIRNVHVEW